MKSARLVFLLAVVLTLTATAVAQEGHPLTGTWYGDFGMTSSQRNDLTVIMKWDGKQTTGMINPGPNTAKKCLKRFPAGLYWSACGMANSTR